MTPEPSNPTQPDPKSAEPTPTALDALSVMKQQLEEYTGLLKQLQADFENYQKRVDREKAEWQQWGAKQLALDLLSVMDSLEAGIQHAVTDSEKAGLQKVADQLKSVLLQHHIRPIDATGKKFDPLRHECITFTQDNQQADGIVTVEISKGYLMHQQVLRHSRVQVNQLPEKTENKTNEKPETSEKK